MIRKGGGGANKNKSRSVMMGSKSIIDTNQGSSNTSTSPTDSNSPVVASLKSSSVSSTGKSKPTNAISLSSPSGNMNTTTISPSYHAIALSPCREYGMLACKDMIQLIRISPDGIQLMKAIVVAPYFQQQTTNSNSTSNTPDSSMFNRFNNNSTSRSGGIGMNRSTNTSSTSIESNSFLNLRDFALGGGTGNNSNNIRSSVSSAPQTSNNNPLMDIVITDVAWSNVDANNTNKLNNTFPPNRRDSVRTDITNSDHTDSDSASNSYNLDYSRRNATSDRQQQQQKQSLLHQQDLALEKQKRLRSSMIAAAGSNGVIVVWNVETLLGLDDSATPTIATPAAPSNKSNMASTTTMKTTNQSSIIPCAILSQHVHRVNSLSWHPTKDCVLLSASQDCTVVLWERRLKDDPSKVNTSGNTVINNRSTDKVSNPGLKGFLGVFGVAQQQQQQQQFQSQSTPKQTQQSSYQWHCRTTYSPKSEAIRAVQWSPFYEDGKPPNRADCCQSIFSVYDNMTHLVLFLVCCINKSNAITRSVCTCYR
jgi:hypothetical protein